MALTLAECAKSRPGGAALYKRRWQVELFFKWIKQNGLN
jgi:hypothetical protein